MSGRQRHHRACHLCEAICGLIIEHDGQHVHSVKGDAEDPLSRGHICPKAVALQDIHTDPNRLKRPLKKTPSGWAEVTWNEAYDEIAQRTLSIRKKHGSEAIGMYLGNPTVHNYGALLFVPQLSRAFGRGPRFSATSVDQLPHHVAGSLMFGHSLLLPVPDIDRTDLMLIMGANPVASNGSIMTAPGVAKRLKAIQNRGGKVVVIDPRRTETASIADQHHAVYPGTDVWLLAAIVNLVLPHRRGTPPSWTKGFAELERLIRRVTPPLAAKKTGLKPQTIVTLADTFLRSKRAVCYGRMGLSTQAHGGLCQWLVNVLNICSGNFDVPGGAMFPRPAVPIVRGESTTSRFNRWQSRVRGLPEFDGSLPVATLAEEILTPGAGQIHAMFINAGNPVLSTPNGQQLERAFEQLSLMVCVDIFHNETTQHADFILPPTAALENDNYDVVFNALAVRNTARYSPALFESEPDTRRDWEIFSELSRRIPDPRGWWSRAKTSIIGTLMRGLKPRGILNIGLLSGPYGAWRWSRLWRGGLSLRRLKESVHGLDLGALRPQLPDCLQTPDRLIDLAPRPYCQRFEEVVAEALETAPPADGKWFRVIGRRHVRDNNSWMHHVARLVRGRNRCTIHVNPLDAEDLGIHDGQTIGVRTRVGEIQLPVWVTDTVMPGVVCIPHGYGHHRTASHSSVEEAYAGVSVNDIMDEQRVDTLTGNAAFSGQPVQLFHPERREQS